MAPQSVRRGRDNQGFPQCLEHAWVIWIWSANSHTGRRLSSCHVRGRTDESIRPRVAPILRFSLPEGGRPQMETEYETLDVVIASSPFQLSREQSDSCRASPKFAGVAFSGPRHNGAQ
jgi:hypothetical protein